jgi:hypothetical protein
MGSGSMTRMWAGVTDRSRSRSSSLLAGLVQAFEGKKAETTTMLPTIRASQAA